MSSRLPLRQMFGSPFRVKGSFRRVAGNPVTVACAAAFVLAVGVASFLMARSAMRDARALLLAAAADMRESVNTCADNLLFYQGHAIVSHYLRPEAMTCETVQELMARYGLDEINVVNANGVVLAGALAQVGYDMGSNPNTAKFNCLLAGAKTYSQPFRPPIEDPTGPRFKYAGVAFPWPVKGYIQIGFGEARLKHGIDFWFEDAALDWHIGERGYYVIADAETSHIKSCGWTNPSSGGHTFSRGLSLGEIGLDVASLPASPTQFFRAKIFGEDCLCLSEVRCFHRIVSVLPVSEIMAGGVRLVTICAGVLLAVFALVVFFMTKLTNLVVSLQEKERVERERRLKDMTMAQTIQFSSLPLVRNEAGSPIRIAAQMDPAREVGGDFFDFYGMPSGRFFFLIADVAGKGVPAAMFMMKAKTTIRACAFEGDDFAEVIGQANSVLADNNEANMFVTAWFGLLDPKTGVVEYVNAGHNPPLVKRASGAVEWVRGKRGLVLAAMGGARYAVERLTLAPGDKLLLYTDGVTEAMDAAGALFGEDRLARALAESGPDAVGFIRARVAEFVGGAERSDDITMLSVDFIPSTDNPERTDNGT